MSPLVGGDPYMSLLKEAGTRRGLRGQPVTAIASIVAIENDKCIYLPAAK